MKSQAFCCWSGGKDCLLAHLRASHEVEVTYLLNMVDENGLSSRSHGLTSGVLKHQAETMGIPLVQKNTSRQSYEQRFKEALGELKNKGVYQGVFGDIDVVEHRDWIERVCGEMEITPIFPLWEANREEMLTELMQTGFKAVVVSTKMGQEWLGREIDERFVHELKVLGNVDLCGEKGEYHSFVYDGPIFKKPVAWTAGKTTFKDNRWFMEIKV